MSLPAFVFLNSPGPACTRLVPLQLRMNLAFPCNVTWRDVFFFLVLREPGTGLSCRQHKGLIQHLSITMMQKSLVLTRALYPVNLVKFSFRKRYRS